VSTDGGNTFALSGVGGIPHLNQWSPSPAQSRRDDKVLLRDENPGDVSPACHRGGLFKVPRRLFVGLGPAQLELRTTGIARVMAGLVAMAQNDISPPTLAGQQMPLIIPFFTRPPMAGRTGKVSVNHETIKIFTPAAAGRRPGLDLRWPGRWASRSAPNDSVKLSHDLGSRHLSTTAGAFWKQVYLIPADQKSTTLPPHRAAAYRSVGLENTSCW